MAWGAVIGLATSVIGGIMQKKQADKQASSQEYAATQNRQAMEKEAEYQRFRTSILLKRQKQYTQSVLGAQRAVYAKNGIQVDTGTALQVAEATAAQAAEDAMLIRQEGEFNIERAMLGADMYGRQAQATNDIRQAGNIEMGTTLLTSGWDFASNMGWV